MLSNLNYSFEEGIKLVRGDNITEGWLRWRDKTRYWKTFSEDLSDCVLLENDIVIGMMVLKLVKISL